MKGILAALRPAVVAMIASAGISLVILAFYGQRTLPKDLGGINYISVALFCVSLFVLRRFRIRPICVMVGAGALGTLASLLI